MSESLLTIDLRLFNREAVLNSSQRPNLLRRVLIDARHSI